MKRPLYLDKRLIELAIAEDLGRGDITTAAVVDPNKKGRGIIMAKENLVLCGGEVAEYIFHKVDPSIKVQFRRLEGEALIPADIVMIVEGKAASILQAERTVLNFLQRLSGVATMTRMFVDAIEKGSKTKITDTRKTTPGWRTLDKYAVQVGGGVNHRLGLDDGILIKDNHIAAAGSITAAIELARKKAHHLLKIEVETANLAMVEEALNAKADVIMLDNMRYPMMQKAIELIGDKALIEISGGVEFDKIPELSRLNADLISCGAITHSATAKDINLSLELA